MGSKQLFQGPLITREQVEDSIFVASSIVRQCIALKYNGASKIAIGNVNIFRD
jgi:GDP-D-mannose dehydratase